MMAGKDFRTMKPTSWAELGMAIMLAVVFLASCAIPTLEKKALAVTPKGWELNETNTGLAGVGIEAYSLPIYRGPSKPAKGAVIAEMKIETTLDLSAGGITIERCWIRPASISRGNNFINTFDNNGHQEPAPENVVVRDCDIDGTALSAYDVCFSAAFVGNGTVERCHIYGMGSGVAIFHAGDKIPALIQGNYIHGLRAWGNPATDGSHNDGFTIRDYAGPSAVVRNNRIDCSSGNDTGAIFIQPYAGFIDNVLVEGNFLEGLGYQLILERHNYDYGTSLRAVDNRFSGTGFGPGYVDRKGLTYGWAEWQDNFRSDPSKEGNRGARTTM
jgi:hypothetical protein